jgi:hypothetical protein
VIMFKMSYLWTAVATTIAMFSTGAGAQTPDQNPAISFQNRGTYSTYGNQTYGPHGTLQQRQGNQTYTIDRSGLGGPGPTYSTLGHQTYGSDGSVLYNYGNWSHDKDGTVSQTQGNQTNFYRPGEKTVTCSTYGTQTVCR